MCLWCCIFKYKYLLMSYKALYNFDLPTFSRAVYMKSYNRASKILNFWDLHLCKLHNAQVLCQPRYSDGWQYPNFNTIVCI